MNAETRAKEIVDDLASRVMAHGWEEDFHHPLLRQAESLIAQAIRRAENDKLEEAAALFPVKKTRVSYYRAATIQERIRSLKTTKD